MGAIMKPWPTKPHARKKSGWPGGAPRIGLPSGDWSYGPAHWRRILISPRIGMRRTSRRAYVARNSSVEPLPYVGSWPGMVTPPTISPRIDWLQYSPLDSSLTIGRRNGLSGSDEQISWRIG